MLGTCCGASLLYGVALNPEFEITIFTLFGEFIILGLAMVGLNVTYFMFEFSEQSLRKEPDLLKRARLRQAMFWKLTALTALAVAIIPFLLSKLLMAIS